MNTGQQPVNLLDIQTGEEIKSSFSALAKWINYAAIVGLLSAVLSLISAFLTYNRVSGLVPGSGASGLMGSMVGFAFSVFLNLTLFAAAKKMVAGLGGSDQFIFNEGLGKLSLYFRVIGIVVLILLIIALLIFMLAMLGAAMS